jgi:hypothetical protein
MAKPFDRESYLKNDWLAKSLIREHLNAQSLYTRIKVEDFKADLYSMDVLGDNYFRHEVEIKEVWIGQWPKVWIDLQIPARKEKQLGQVDWFWVISNCHRWAWCVSAKHVEASPKEWIPTKVTDGPDHFFKVKLLHCKMIKLLTVKPSGSGQEV